MGTSKNTTASPLKISQANSLHEAAYSLGSEISATLSAEDYLFLVTPHALFHKKDFLFFSSPAGLEGYARVGTDVSPSSPT